MVAIGKGYLPENTIDYALKKCTRNAAGDTAPARGLMMTRVVYSNFDTEEVLKSVQLY